MALWGNTDTANDAPSYTVDATTGRSGIQEYGNTVFAIKKGDSANTSITGPGWVRVVKGQGVVTGLTVTAGGQDYANGEEITVGNDSGTIATNANGAITSVSISFGNEMIDEMPTVDVDTSVGSGATFTVLTDGKIGRTFVESLVPIKSIS